MPFEINDRVKVVKEDPNWPGWAPEMNGAINLSGKIIERGRDSDTLEYGYRIKFDNSDLDQGYWYRERSIEKINKTAEEYKEILKYMGISKEHSGKEKTILFLKKKSTYGDIGYHFKDSYIEGSYTEEIKDEDLIEEEYEKNPANLKVGDDVKIIRTAKRGERGWSNFWNKEMDSAVGVMGIVLGIKEGNDGITVRVKGLRDYDYPAFVLEKIEKKSNVVIYENNPNGLKRGDRVKVIRAAKSNESGWRNDWVPEMDKSIGKIGTVLTIEKNNLGIVVEIDDMENFTYPPFVLGEAEEKTEDNRYKMNPNGLKKGDYVKILRKPIFKDNKWENNWGDGIVWRDEMDLAIGRIGEITSINSQGINVHIAGISLDYNYPSFILEKIEKETLEKEKTILEKVLPTTKKEYQINPNGLNEGDTVMVLRKPEKYDVGEWEQGWAKMMVWPSEMDEAIGKIGIVISIGVYGVKVKIPEIETDYNYPEFILAKQVKEDKETKEDKTPIITTPQGIKKETLNCINPLFSVRHQKEIFEKGKSYLINKENSYHYWIEYNIEGETLLFSLSKEKEDGEYFIEDYFNIEKD